MSNTENTRIDLPHIELTGKITAAYAYRYPKTSDKGRDMFGIIFWVKLKERDSKSFTATIRKINWPMNSNAELIASFNEMLREKMGKYETARVSLSDKVEFEQFRDMGIRTYVRMLDENAPGGQEYYVNEKYPVEPTDEPIYMTTIPDVPKKEDVSTKGQSQIRQPKTRQPKARSAK